MHTNAYTAPIQDVRTYVVTSNLQHTVFKYICNGCNTGTSALPDMYVRVPVLQLICYTSGTLKSAQIV